MPLIQFLAYYQVLEFYFQRYSRQETWKDMRKVLTDPRFDPQRDSELQKLSEEAQKHGRNKGSRLTAVIRGCVSPAELRAFFADNEFRYNYYKSELPEMFTKKTGLPEDRSSNSLSAVASRINRIRNRIVHTEDQEPLLPSDPEIEKLRHDIELVEFLARKALKSSGYPLRV